MSENQNVELIDQDNDDDEFGGAMISIDMLRAKSHDSTITSQNDEFESRVIGSKEPNEKQRIKDELLKLPPFWDCIATDAEYIPVTDDPTQPFCSSIYSANNTREYLHPECIINKNPYANQDLRRKLKVMNELQSLRAFKSPFVMLDFLEEVYGIKWREQSHEKKRYIKTLKIFMFFSFKDLQFLFAKNADFLYYCLSFLERIRRITTKFNKPISLPYEIYLPTTKGMKWHSINLEIVDICAMQGAKPLEVYFQNVGLVDNCKGVWDWDKNGDAYDFLMNHPQKFLKYIRGDANKLIEVYKLTLDKYNEIAGSIGIEGDCENWGMSCGKITASMTSCWLGARQNIMLPVSTNSRDTSDMKPLYWYTRLASPEALKNLSHLVGKKALLYLGMTDGGRCVKERSKVDFLDGVLCDIDITAAYGKGLLNQIFPVGNPSIIFNPINFKNWEKEYSKQLIPGLWVARISWKDAPFNQDLLLSKIPKLFVAWDWYQQHFSENHSDANNQYDATMYLGTNEVHMAAFTHDFYQVILNETSNQELAWIRENAVIEAFAYYDKDEEIPKVIPEMAEMRSVKELHSCGVKWSTKWVRVELKEMIGILIENRANHKNIIANYNKHYGKKNQDAKLEDIPTSEVIDGVQYSKTDFLYRYSIQEFIKLIVNTVYGCIASSYFSGEGTGISNYIVGNNITGRCRVLAWAMAKGLYSLMSITDGGVFDANTVAYYIRKSLDIFANLGYAIFHKDRHEVIQIKPLYDTIIPKTEEMFSIKKDIHLRAWEHLKNQFPKLDIFKYNQYSFEVKNLYTQCTIRNKSDYELYNELLPRDKKNPVYKVRGLSQKDGDGLAALIFDDVRNNIAGVHQINTKRLLGLKEWQELDSEIKKKLTPHDQISDKKNFYSLTPLGSKFINAEHHKVVMRLYDQLKEKERPDLIQQIKLMENVASLEEFKALKRQLNAKCN